MAEPAYLAEQIWLRSYLDYSDEVCFELSAEKAMLRQGITLVDVMAVLRCGTITNADRDERGAKIKIEGRNCDDEDIEISGRIISEMMHVSIVNVRRN